MATSIPKKPARSEREFSRLTLTRLGRNEALERRPHHNQESQRPTERLPFQCECEGERCRETVSLSRADYEHVRAHPGWLIVAPGHQVAGTRFQERLEGCCVLVPGDRRKT
jgi:hypothetical protein